MASRPFVNCSELRLYVEIVKRELDTFRNKN